jgi:hypothetical protein
MPIAARHRMTGRVARLATCCIAAAMIWACGPVFIPVPPPAAETVFTSELVIDEAGNPRQQWIAEGGPDARASDALFLIFDQERNAGVIAGAGPDGSYRSPPMEGTEGDHVFIHFRDTRGQDSPTACVLLSERRPFAEHCP